MLFAVGGRRQLLPSLDQKKEKKTKRCKIKTNKKRKKKKKTKKKKKKKDFFQLEPVPQSDAGRDLQSENGPWKTHELELRRRRSSPHASRLYKL